MYIRTWVICESYAEDMGTVGS